MKLPYGKDYKPNSRFYPYSLIKKKTKLFTPPDHEEGGLSYFFNCVSMFKYGTVNNPKIVKWQNECGGEGRFLTTEGIIKKTAAKYNLAIHRFQIASTIGGFHIQANDIVNVDGKKRMAILIRLDNLNANALIIPKSTTPSKKNLPLLDYAKCETCSIWRMRVGFTAHIKICIKCPCGTAYKQGEEHGLHCHRMSIKDKKEAKIKGIARVYKASTEKEVNVSTSFFADIETMPITTNGNKYTSYSIALARPTDPVGFALVWSGKDCMEQFFEEICQHKGILWFYNGGRFDVYFLIQHCLNSGIEIKSDSILKKGTTIMAFTIITLRGEMQVKDMCRFIPGSLKRNCKAYGVSEGAMKGDFDHMKMKTWEDVKTHKVEFEAYVKQDVIAMRAVFLAYSAVVWEYFHIHASDYMTASHLAYAAWSSEQQKIRFDLHCIPIDMEKKVRSFYRGGRIICGRPEWISSSYEACMREKTKIEGEKGYTSEKISQERYDRINDYWVYGDVNSLYPSVMATENFPIGEPEHIEVSENLNQRLLNGLNKITPTVLEYWNRTAGKISCKCPKNLSIAFLMERSEAREVTQTLHPKIEQWYTGPEIIEAVRLGYRITKVHEVISWPKAEPIFKSFILKAYKLKQENVSGDPRYAVSKSWMNDMSGKPAQETCNTKIHLVQKTEDIELKGRLVEVTPVQNNIGKTLKWMLTEEFDSEFSNYPIQLSCFILGHSKVTMSRFIRESGLKCEYVNGVGYSDTDSYILHRKSWEKINADLKHDTKLGCIKQEVEGKIIAFACLAPKTYLITYVHSKTLEILCRIRCKGIPHRGDDYPAFIKMATGKIEDEKLDITMRRYEFVNTETNEVENLQRIPADYFHDILHGDRTVKAVFGAMKREFNYANTDNICITPVCNTRTVMKTRWWDSGKRIIKGPYAFPPGHKQLKEQPL